MLIRLGHSPDSDDAFMFWALASGKVDTPLTFQHTLKDIQTLNEWAVEGRLECTAVSVHGFAHVADKYALLRHGASFGDNYGPMLVSREPGVDLRQATIAIPGLLTSAYLALRLYMGNGKSEVGSRDPIPDTRHPIPHISVVPFDQIVPAVLEGRYDVGLIIHESQLTHKDEGLVLLQDLGVWWMEETGLPLPLGVNVVRRDLGPEVMAEVSRALRASIELGLAHRQAALDYALSFGRGMNRATADEFVGMYVNEMTREMGEWGLSAIREFLSRGAAMGLVPSAEFEVVPE